MTRQRLRTDLSHLVSWILLASAAATIATGIIADAWDLNGFRTHTVAGYVMTVAALAHVVLSWRRLTSYARFRTGHARRLLAGTLRRPPDGAGWAARRGAARPSTPPRSDAARLATDGADPAARATRTRAPRPALAGAPGGPDAGAGPRIGAGDRIGAGPRIGAGDRIGAGARARAGASSGMGRRRLFGIAATGAAGFVAGRGLRQPPAIPHGADVGVIYHEWSKPGVMDALGTLTNWGRKPPLYKQYPQAPFVALPEPAPAGGMSLGEAIGRRHSTREYDATPLPAATLATLVQHCGGLREGVAGRRTAPSSGALYPIEIYPVVSNVDGVAPGVYHYDIRRHGLSLVRSGPAGADVMRYGLDQDFLATANVVVVLTLIHQRMRFKYRDRSYRYGLLEAGHLGQNLYLTATAMGLGACGVGAFHDDGINGLLGVDGREEAAVYLLATGVRAA